LILNFVQLVIWLFKTDIFVFFKALCDGLENILRGKYE